MSLDKKFNCPSCRKEYQIDPFREESAVCSRCDCELEMLIVIRESVTALLTQVWKALQSMDGELASLHAEHAWQLMELAEIAESGLIAAVLKQDQLDVLKWRKRLLTFGEKRSR